MLPSITNMNAYLKTLSLQKTASERSQNPKLENQQQELKNRSLPENLVKDYFLKGQPEENNPFRNHPVYLVQSSTNTSLIGSKLAKGQPVSQSELEYLEKHDPKLALEARFANERRKSLAKAIQSKKTRQEKLQLTNQARLQVLSAVDKLANPSLHLEAIAEAEKGI